MSPYRVKVQTGEEDTIILSAMLSTDRITGKKMIYIVKKLDVPTQIPGQLSLPIDSHNKDKQIAHRITGSKNCNILGQYRLFYDSVERKYHIQLVYDHVADDDWGYGQASRLLPICEYTQSDCLRSTMKIYCETYNYTIIDEL